MGFAVVVGGPTFLSLRVRCDRDRVHEIRDSDGRDEELKLNPVIAFDCAEAYVWSLQNFVLRGHILKPCPDNPTLAFLIFARSACAISACGNFAVVGTASGWIERFNLQSGISRGSYLDKSETRSYSHDGEVVGVACDSTNTLMISAGYHGHGDVKVWDFKKRELKFYHRVNGKSATIRTE
ncbi:BnaAnng21570D [Brassica napus]|uniref:BnaAnng21570D protein n=1 Tax=Brassica napus TaxID=3708 RepID=A0A078JHY3_BRANA|nr:BnaAnng21570D [Brassica napus]